MKEQTEQATDLALCFKRFAAALLRADKSLSILNWFHPLQNPIKNAGDIACDEETIKNYYAGMRILHSRQRVLGTIKVRTTESFKKTKGETQFWTWLTRNKVWIRQTHLSQSRHANLGWIMYSHPEYTNQALASEDIKNRLEDNTLEIELVPHQLSHTEPSGMKIMTKALKVRCNYDDREKVLEQLMQAMAKGEGDSKLTTASNSTHFRFIPFNNNPLTSDQIAKAIKRQNAYLHDTYAISVINIASVSERFPETGENIVEESTKKSIADYLRTYTSSKSKKLMFSSLEPGRPGQYYFLTSKTIKDEAEQYVDRLFDSLLLKYGEEQCRVLCKSLENTLPHREQKLRVTQFMADYIKGLDLDSMDVPSAEEPPATAKRQRCILSYNDSDKSNVWQTPLLGENEKVANADQTTTSANSNPTTITTKEYSIVDDKLKEMETEFKRRQDENQRQAEEITKSNATFDAKFADFTKTMDERMQKQDKEMALLRSHVDSNNVMTMKKFDSLIEGNKARDRKLDLILAQLSGNHSIISSNVQAPFISIPPTKGTIDLLDMTSTTTNSSFYQESKEELPTGYSQDEHAKEMALLRAGEQ